MAGEDRGISLCLLTVKRNTAIKDDQMAEDIKNNVYEKQQEPDELRDSKERKQ